MRNMIDNKRLEIIKNFKPIHDIFFEVLADDAAFCQEILRVILEDNKLIVHDVKVQKDVRNLIGRSVRVDVLCTLGDGTLCNIEVQRANNDNHFKRIRYNAACITASEAEVGSRFENVPNVIIVYISEFDILKAGKTIYHIDKVVRETGKILDDGMKTVCVNTKVNDGSLIAQLMQLFIKTEVNEPKFPVFTNRMNYIKNSEGGQRQMSELMELYFKEELEASREEGREEGRAEGRAEGREEGREKGREEGRAESKAEIIQEMLKDNMSIDKIAQYTDMDIKYILKIQSNMLEKGQL